jgi:hypothetical protein
MVMAQKEIHHLQQSMTMKRKFPWVALTYRNYPDYCSEARPEVARFSFFARHWYEPFLTFDF